QRRSRNAFTKYSVYQAFECVESLIAEIMFAQAAADDGKDFNSITRIWLLPLGMTEGEGRACALQEASKTRVTVGHGSVGEAQEAEQLGKQLGKMREETREAGALGQAPLGHAKKASSGRG
ncbi:unnamed protein product, partial [Ilex paraguariensis]